MASRWSPHTGFTALIRFGDTFTERRLPAIRALPLASVAGAGYDGQFYAQLAVDPDVRLPQVRAALDVPGYRAQRILLPLIAHLAVSPWWILQAFALLNVAARLLLARIWWAEVRKLAPDRATPLWLAGVLALGALDSLRLCLVDLPATLLILLAIPGTAPPAPASGSPSRGSPAKPYCSPARWLATPFSGDAGWSADWPPCRRSRGLPGCAGNSPMAARPVS